MRIQLSCALWVGSRQWQLHISLKSSFLRYAVSIVLSSPIANEFSSTEFFLSVIKMSYIDKELLFILLCLRWDQLFTALTLLRVSMRFSQCSVHDVDDLILTRRIAEIMYVHSSHQFYILENIPQLFDCHSWMRNSNNICITI